MALFGKWNHEARKRSPLANALAFAGIQQIVIVLMASMILDGGLLCEICLFACAGFWGGIGVRMMRRRRHPLTPRELSLIRGVYIFLCFLSFFICGIIWKWRGV